MFPGPHAVADLDLAPFERAARRLEGMAEQLDRKLAEPLVARPEVDPRRFQQDSRRLETLLAQLVQRFDRPLTVRPVVDTTRMRQGVDQAGREMQRLAQSTGSGQAGFLALGSAAVAGGLVAGRAILGVIDKVQQLTASTIAASTQMETAVARVRAIAPEVDASQATRELNRLQTEVTATSVELAKGLENIFQSLDIPLEDALRLTKLFAQGALAASTSTDVFGAAIVGALQAYKQEISEAERFSDVFFETVRAGNVSGQVLASNLGALAQSANRLNVPMETLGALIAGVTLQGGNADQNLNNLNNTLQKLATGEAQRGLRDLGVRVTDANGQFRDTLVVLAELQQALDKLTPAAKAAALQEIFPDLQARAGLEVLLNQLPRVVELQQQNAKAVGTTERAYQTMAATADAEFKILENNINKLQQTISGRLVPILSKVFQRLQEDVAEVDQVLETLLGHLGPRLNSINRQIERSPALRALFGLQATGQLPEPPAPPTSESTAQALGMRTNLDALGEEAVTAAAEIGARFASQFAATLADGDDTEIAAAGQELVQGFEARVRELMPGIPGPIMDLVVKHFLDQARAKAGEMGQVGEELAAPVRSQLIVGLEEAAGDLTRIQQLLRDHAVKPEDVITDPEASQEAIAGLLGYTRALERLDQATKQLVDADIAAEVQRLRNNRQITEAVALADAHTAAQEATAEATRQRADAERRAADEARKAAEEAAKFAKQLADIPTEGLAARLDRLAGATFPALTAAEQSHVQQLQALSARYLEQGNAAEALATRQAAVQFAFDRSGVSAAHLDEILQGQNLTMDQAGKVLDEFVRREERAAEAAKQLAESHATHAEAVAKARATLQESLAEADKRLVEAIADAETALAEAADNLDRAARDFDAKMAEIATSLADAQQAEADAIAAARSALSSALQGLDRQEARLARDFFREAADRQRQFVEAVAQQRQQLAQQMQGFHRDLVRTAEAAAAQQRDALVGASQALSNLQRQGEQAAATASQRLEDIERRLRGALGTEELQELLRERIRLQAQIGFEQVQAAAQRDQTRQSLQQRQVDIQQQMAERLTDILEAAAGARTAFEEGLARMLRDNARAAAEAWERHREQLKQIQEQREEAFARFRAALEAARKARKEAEERAKKAREEAEKRFKEQREVAEKAAAKVDEQLAKVQAEVAETRQQAERRFFTATQDAQKRHNETVRKLGGVQDQLRDIGAKLGVTQQVTTGNLVVQETSIDALAAWTAGMRQRLRAGNVG